MNSDPRDEALFLELVLVFQQSAWVALGKIQNPQTGKVEVDLKVASHAIDMLSMLKSRTHHCQSPAERAIVDNALTQLRLNYVEAVSEAEVAKVGTKTVAEGVAGTGGTGTEPDA